MKTKKILSAFADLSPEANSLFQKQKLNSAYGKYAKVEKPKHPGFRHYMVKAPGSEMRLLSAMMFTYDDARREAVKLGGIVTNLSFVHSVGMLTGPVRIPAVLQTMHGVRNETDL